MARARRTDGRSPRPMTLVRVEKDVERLSLTLVADFDASIERVWQLWADPRQLERWWGPPSHPSTVETHDLVAGGEVTYFMTGPEGETSRGWWRITAVDPPSRSSSSTASPTATGRPNADTADHHRPDAARPSTAAGPGWSCASTSSPREHMDRLERWGAFAVFPQSVAQMDAIIDLGGNRQCARSSRTSSSRSTVSSRRRTSGTSRTSTTRWAPRSAPPTPPPTRC